MDFIHKHMLISNQLNLKLQTDRSKAVILVLFRVGVLCRVL